MANNLAWEGSAKCCLGLPVCTGSDMDLLKGLAIAERGIHDTNIPIAFHQPLQELLKPNTIWAYVCPRCGKKYCTDCAKQFFDQSVRCSCGTKMEVVTTRDIIDLRSRLNLLQVSSSGYSSYERSSTSSQPTSSRSPYPSELKTGFDSAKQWFIENIPVDVRWSMAQLVGWFIGDIVGIIIVAILRFKTFKKPRQIFGQVIGILLVAVVGLCIGIAVGLFTAFGRVIDGESFGTIGSIIGTGFVGWKIGGIFWIITKNIIALIDQKTSWNISGTVQSRVMAHYTKFLGIAQTSIKEQLASFFKESNDTDKIEHDVQETEEAKPVSQVMIAMDCDFPTMVVQETEEAKPVSQEQQQKQREHEQRERLEREQSERLERERLEHEQRERKTQLQKKFQVLLQRVRANQRDAHAWRELGELLHSMGETDKAKDCFQRVERLTGESVQLTTQSPNENMQLVQPAQESVLPQEKLQSPHPVKEKKSSLPQPLSPRTYTPTVQALLQNGREHEVLWFPNLLVHLMKLFNNMGLQETAPVLMYDQNPFRQYRSDHRAEVDGPVGHYFLHLIGEMNPEEITLVQQAYQQHPDSPILTICLGFSYLRFNQVDKWVDYMSLAGDLAEKMMSSLPPGDIRTFYQNLFSRYFLGMTFLVQRDTHVWKELFVKALVTGGEALEKIKEVLLHDSGGVQMRKDMAHMYWGLGSLIFNVETLTGNADQAIAYQTEAIKLYPELSEAHDCIGLYYIHTNRLDQAIAAWERGMREAHPNIEMVMNLARAYGLKGVKFFEDLQFSKALPLLEQALTLELSLPTPRQRQTNIAAFQERIEMIQIGRRTMYSATFDDTEYQTEKQRLQQVTRK